MFEKITEFISCIYLVFVILSELSRNIVACIVYLQCEHRPATDSARYYLRSKALNAPVNA